MKKILFLLVLISGCSIQTRVAENADSIHPEIANKENAVQIANKENAVHVEKEAVKVEKDAVHIEKDALHIEKDAVGHIEKGAFNVEKDALNLTGTVQSGAVQLPVNVQSGAVQMPLTTNVAEGSVKVNLSLNVAEGAIVVKGLEPGAVQTKIEAPWWSYIIMGLLGLGWLITKFRKHHKVYNINKDKEMEHKPSIWDILF